MPTAYSSQVISSKNVHLTTQILNNSGVEVATLTWKFRGLCQEVMTDSDTFVLKFNGPMPSQDKALLIGATILMDFMYYEHNGDNGGG